VTSGDIVSKEEYTVILKNVTVRAHFSQGGLVMVKSFRLSDAAWPDAHFLGGSTQTDLGG
jgi:hypothetical protein